MTPPEAERFKRRAEWLMVLPAGPIHPRELRADSSARNQIGNLLEGRTLSIRSQGGTPGSIARRMPRS